MNDMMRSSIRVSRCIACNNTDVGVTCKSPTVCNHGCKRCYPEDFGAVAELQKQRWLEGASEDEIAAV